MTEWTWGDDAPVPHHAQVRVFFPNVLDTEDQHIAKLRADTLLSTLAQSVAHPPYNWHIAIRQLRCASRNNSNPHEGSELFFVVEALGGSQTQAQMRHLVVAHTCVLIELLNVFDAIIEYAGERIHIFLLGDQFHFITRKISPS